MQISLDPELSSILVLGALVIDDLTVVERESKLDAPLAEAEHNARMAATGADPAPVRAMYRRVGLDPTKTRPSSEALLRRVSRGDSLPRINSLVDVCNWCSLEFQLPYGLYDADQISGDVELRLGREGEEYPGIRKDVVHLEAVRAEVALADIALEEALVAHFLRALAIAEQLRGGGTLARLANTPDSFHRGHQGS